VCNLRTPCYFVFPQQQCVYIDKIHSTYRIKRLYVKVQEHCQRRYPDVHLTRWQFYDFLRVFETEITGQEKIGQLSELRAEKLEDVPVWLIESPRKKSQGTCITHTHTHTSYSSTQRTVWKLHLCPYRIGPGQGSQRAGAVTVLQVFFFFRQRK
jgi:hypothetical protein